LAAPPVSTERPAVAEVFDCGGVLLPLDRPHVVGILNLTPDSFSDGGHFADPARAVERAWAMVEEGASIVELGGESTRPGAPPVSPEDEARRVLPVLERLEGFPRPLALDTSEPALMRAGAERGVRLVNDVRALRRPGALETVASLGLAVCLMHMRGEPATMQVAPSYDDVVEDVRGFLAARRDACLGAGMRPNTILLDPGFGFGKTLGHNRALLRSLGRFRDLGCPLLVGLSRKSFVGALGGGRAVGERLAASLAAAVLAYENGAMFLRVHDVRATRDALDFAHAIRAGEAA
jgi:dihydropteroate synthase